MTQFPARPPLDPFLRAHFRKDRYYSVAGKYSPASIRDQMVRATALMTRAWQTKLIGATKSVLVVGAGVAGASAAVWSAAQGIPTTLVEREKIAFVQQTASQRIIDPTEYDWPARHWHIGRCPYDRRCPLPFPWKTDRADRLASRWRNILNEYCGEYSKLTFLPQHALTGFFTADEGSIVCRLQNLWNTHRIELKPSFVLDCRGAGRERTCVGPFCAPSFWSEDRLDRKNLDFPTQPRVLISGGGDGALQDLLRLLLGGKRAGEAYQELPLRARHFIESRVLHAEDHFRREFIWSSYPDQDCTILSRVHNAHRETARAAIAHSTFGSHIQAVLDRLIRPLVPVESLYLAHPCTHFHPSYPLNRFLALLANEYLIKKGFTSRFLTGRRLSSVSSADRNHSCDHKAAECGQYSHHTGFVNSACVGPPEEGKTEDSEFDVIILRHGLDGDMPPQSRQILPFTLPWC